jgi:hypothetical protein
LGHEVFRADTLLEEGDVVGEQGFGDGDPEGETVVEGQILGLDGPSGGGLADGERGMMAEENGGDDLGGAAGFLVQEEDQASLPALVRFPGVGTATCPAGRSGPGTWRRRPSPDRDGEPGDRG